VVNSAPTRPSEFKRWLYWNRRALQWVNSDFSVRARLILEYIPALWSGLHSNYDLFNISIRLTNTKSENEKVHTFLVRFMILISLIGK
jgi:hypothetical protein